MQVSLQDKIDRIRSGEPPRVLDLFSGCGGLTVGFRLAGFTSLGGLDVNRPAMATHWFNFHLVEYQAFEETPAFDLKVTTPADYGAWAGIGDPAALVDVLVGGPPCQAYSRIGRKKLASLAGTEDAHIYDERGFLFDHFLEWTEEVNPLVVLIENVPDSLNYGGVNIPEYISRDLEEMGFDVAYTILNSVHYNVPQGRERVFILGIRRELGRSPVFPKPTHRYDRDPEFRAQRSRIHALVERAELNGGKTHATLPPECPAETLLPAIGCEEALSDLPFMSTRDATSSSRPGSKDVLEKRPYSSPPASPYQELMRTWPDFSTGRDVSGNNIRWTPRDFETFALMKDGDNYLKALSIAEGRLERQVAEWTLAHGAPPDSEQYGRLMKAIVPPYSREKFDSKWMKLSRGLPSHTVVAHLSTDTYSHIHYDSVQARGVSVREAARLQSFPDGFRFLGNMSEAFSMIGNAVPPLLAYNLALEIQDTLRN